MNKTKKQINLGAKLKDTWQAVTQFCQKQYQLVANQLRSNLALRILVGVVVLLIVAVFVVAIYSKMHNRLPAEQKQIATEANTSNTDKAFSKETKAVYNSINLAGVPELSTNKHFSYANSLSSQLYLRADRIVQQVGDYLILADIDGYQLNSYQTQIAKPLVIQNKDKLWVADLQGSAVVGFADDKVIYHSTVDNACGGIATNEQYVALIQNNVDQTGFVHLDRLKDGQRLFTIQFAEVGYPLAVNFSPDGKALDVLLCNTNTSQLRGIIRRYSLSGQLLQEVTLDDDNHLYSKLSYDPAGNWVVVGPSSLLTIEVQNPQEKSLFSLGGNLLQVIEREKEHLFLVESSNHELMLLRLQQGKLQEQNTGLSSRSFVNATMRSNQLALASGSQIFTLDLLSGNIVGQADLGRRISQLSVAGNTIVAKTDNNIFTIE